MKKYFLILFILFAGCDNARQPSYLDTDQWSGDTNGCKEYRSELLDEHPALLDDLKGKSEDVILKWLGKPEKNELYSRSQQFYMYSIDPGESCEGVSQNTGRYLQIRFSATGRAQEVMIFDR